MTPLFVYLQKELGEGESNQRPLEISLKSILTRRILIRRGAIRTISVPVFIIWVIFV